VEISDDAARGGASFERKLVYFPTAQYPVKFCKPPGCGTGTHGLVSFHSMGNSVSFSLEENRKWEKGIKDESLRSRDININQVAER
jgi:hypothetical protein